MRSVLLADVDDSVLRQGVATNTRSANVPVYDLEYLDDILLICPNATHLQHMLHTVQAQALLYVMTLSNSNNPL